MAGWRLILWTGDPSAFDDPYVLRKMARGELSVGSVEALRRYDRTRVSVIPKSRRVLGPDWRGGFSRTYTFTAEAPMVWMTDDDAARLMGNCWERWSFMDVTDAPGVRRRVMQPRDWLRLLDDFRHVEQARGNPMAPGGMLARRVA